MMRTLSACPLHHVQPSGWLRDFLQRQRDGLTGHLEHAGYPFNTRGWQSSRLRLNAHARAGWWPYEQYAYWVDGMMRCGQLLNDDFLKRKARRQIDHVLSKPDADGYLGPAALKAVESAERWPHAVFFRAVLADYAERPRPATLRKLCAHYLSGTAPHHTQRNVCNIEIVAWLYEQTGDARLLKWAEDVYRDYQNCERARGATLKNMLSDERDGDHGPTYMELFKLAAIMYRLTGKRRYLQAAENAQRKLERDHVLIDGVPSTTEHLRGIYTTAGHETCVITDYLWSLRWLFQTTGKVRYADAMERIAFNALPGAVTPDFKALQYFSGPNQVVAGPRSNHHPHGTGGTHLSYRPNPGTECCPGNIHRAMPAFAGSMWWRKNEDTVMAALYGPGRVKLDAALSIEQETDYPFRPQVRFHFHCKKPRQLDFQFRIPAWCTGVHVRLNGKPLRRAWKPGTFASLRRTFQNRDCLEVHFDYGVETIEGPEQSVGFVWGPLVMALPIKAKRRIERNEPRSSKEFPAWNLQPASAWNYGVTAPLPEYDLVYATPTKYPWEVAPVRLRIPAHRIAGWKLQERKRLVHRWRKWRKVIEGPLHFTPGMPSKSARARAARKEEFIELVPLGATQLRMTWLPRLPHSKDKTRRR